MNETWCGVLETELAIGNPATVELYESSGGTFAETGKIVTCWPWVMGAGDTIKAGMAVVGFTVNGRRFVLNASARPYR